MKDYKLSELKEICNTNSNCAYCPLNKLCEKLGDGCVFYDLDIEETEDEK